MYHSFQILLYILIGYYTIECTVYTATEHNFTSIISTGAHIIEFYAPWCSHCKALEPNYNDASNIIPKNKLQFNKIDCTSNSVLCKQYNINGYPTIKYTTEQIPNKLLDYKNGRNTNDFIQFSELLNQPAVHHLIHKQSINTLISDNSVLYVLFNDNKVNSIFSNIAYTYHPSQSIKFATAPLTLIKQYISVDSLNECIISISQGRITYNKLDVTNSTSESDIREFIDQNKLSLIPSLSGDVYDIISTQHKYIVELIVDYTSDINQANTQQYINSLYRLAEKYSNEFQFLIVPAHEYGNYLKTYNIHGSIQLPYVLIVDHPIHYYKQEQYTNDTILSVEQIQLFLNKIQNNELHAQCLEPIYSPYYYSALLQYYYTRSNSVIQWLVWLIAGSAASYFAYIIGYNIYLTIIEEYNGTDNNNGMPKDTKKTQ